MLISVRELELHEITFSHEFDPQAIDFGSDVQQHAPLRAQGRAELLQEHRGHGRALEDIRVVGDFSTQLELRCARCLEQVLRNVAGEFDLIYRPRGADAGVEERSIGGSEADIGYYQGEGLLLEDVLREQVLLAVPLKAICNDTCKGLCPRCGQNLNFGTCACQPVQDHRWDALHEIREKLKR
ncbi:MAG TPA: DUF177 domain-containing protein [Terriglobales bacterium]|jgi:uncharacterized protein|nr:DUF177 domain-containing protein [Terriglobales bacterium]